MDETADDSLAIVVSIRYTLLYSVHFAEMPASIQVCYLHTIIFT